MTFKEARNYAMHRGRVRNTVSGAVGNLVDWMPGQYCKVFTGYDTELAGYVKLPNFATWLKSETEKETNSVPVGLGRKLYCWKCGGEVFELDRDCPVCPECERGLV